MKIFDATMSTLERSLDVRLSRQTVLAGNLANANTPGFVQRDLDFAAAMAAASAPAVPEQAALAMRPSTLLETSDTNRASVRVLPLRRLRAV